jgi:hypothetical protein
MNGSVAALRKGEGLTRTAAWTVRLSGLVGAVGIVFLVGMFTAFAAGARSLGVTLGWINDVLVLLAYALLVPTVIATYVITRSRSPVPAAIVAMTGLAGIAWVVVFQSLLVLGVLTFEQQIGLVSAGFLALAVWFVAAGWLLGRGGLLERGAWMGLLGAVYVGYPIWALWIARRFDGLAETGRARDARQTTTTR